MIILVKAAKKKIIQIVYVGLFGTEEWITDRGEKKRMKTKQITLS